MTPRDEPLKKKGRHLMGGKGAAVATLDWGNPYVRCIWKRGPVGMSLLARNTIATSLSFFSALPPNESHVDG